MASPRDSPGDVARYAASRDLIRVTGNHIAGATIAASFFGGDRAEYVRALRSSLASAGVTLAEEPGRLVATFRFSGRTLAILIR